MKPLKYLLILLALALSFTACDDFSDPTNQEVAPLVVEAWIDSGGFPCAIVTTPYQPGSSDDEIAQHLRRWAKVTISDGNEVVVMAGGVDTSVFPPFTYRTYEMRGVPGRTYTITVESDGHHAVASATMPEPVTIESITFVPADEAGRLNGTVSFSTAGLTGPCYLVLFTQVLDQDLRRYPAMMGVMDAQPERQHQQMALFRGRNYDTTESYIPDFAEGDRVEISLLRVDHTIFRFWSDYLQRASFGQSIFFSSDQTLTGHFLPLPSPINQADTSPTDPASLTPSAYGCFTVAGAASVTVTARPGTIPIN